MALLSQDVSELYRLLYSFLTAIFWQNRGSFLTYKNCPDFAKETLGIFENFDDTG